MKICVSAPVKTVTLEDVLGLDPITIFWQDFEPGKGKIVIECYGKAWAAYWGAMSGRSILEFVGDADTDYVANRLENGSRTKKSDQVYLRKIVDAVRAAIKTGGPR